LQGRLPSLLLVATKSPAYRVAAEAQLPADGGEPVALALQLQDLRQPGE
jgi:hypothetical protein